MSVESILESIEKLTLLEAAELVKAMEEKFGVSAAAPVAVAAAPAAGAAEAATEGAAMEAVVERQRMIGGSLVTAAHTYGYSKVMYEARIKVLA